MKIYFIHPRVKSLKDLERHLNIERESLSVDLEWNDNSPDVLIASEWIYYRNSYFKEFKKLYKKATVKVFYAGEAVEPDFNLFDYAIGFDDRLQFVDRFVRHPSPIVFFSKFLASGGGISNIAYNNKLLQREKARVCLSMKKGFCNFLYSNSRAHEMRDRLFYELSKYKKVDSLGKHLNNVGKIGTGWVGHTRDCTKIKSMYKFSIASENAAYSGYTSEKILTSLEAHTIPIYWGNPHISEDVNPECFINVHDYNSFESLISKIKEIDENDDLWIDMIIKPWFTDKQLLLQDERNSIYKRSMIRILNESKPAIANGTHVDFYRKRIVDGIFPLQLNRENFVYYLKKYFFKRLQKI